jgi:adenine-specific DNA-methyltransferase
MVSWGEDGRAIIVQARRVAKGLQVANSNSAQRVTYCRQLLNGGASDPGLVALSDLLADFSTDDRHYWAGVFYTLLLSDQQRRDQAAYFTPPYLANAVLDLAGEFGFDLKTHTALDPAAGGAAFLSTIAGRMAAEGVDNESICSRLEGAEIDPGLARIARILLAERLGLRRTTAVKIAAKDALKASWEKAFDLVVANPPYGRVTADSLPNDRWRDVAHSGHINKYAVFTELSFRAAKDGALVALVIPSSFRTGPLYKLMRTFIREQGEVLTVGTVGTRDDVFVDVAQDVSVLLVRKTSTPSKVATRFSHIGPGPKVEVLADWSLPTDANEPWPTPSSVEVAIGGATLADYGVTVRAGYFVWNRQEDRLRDAAGATTYPLIWARNVRAGETCRPMGKKGEKADFVWFPNDEGPVVREPAVVLQRTTNNKQPRRLVAAMVDRSVIKRWRGFVSENHTIVLTGKRQADLAAVCRLLNTEAVDQRYRSLSGTAAVSVQLLRILDLPPPATFAAQTKLHADADTAAAAAYAAASLAAGARDVA